MSYTATLHKAVKASDRTLSLLDVETFDDIVDQEVWDSADDVEDCCNVLPRSNDYLDPVVIRDSVLSEGANDTDWIQQAVARLNVAIFTNAVWSDNGRYDEPITIFFPLLIPKELHDRDDIVDMFLETVTRWAVMETNWPNDQHTTQDHVVSKIKERIEIDIEDEDQSLRQRIWDAYKKRYEQNDDLDDPQDMLDSQRVKKAWFKVLPIILEAIGSKDEYQPAKDTSDNAIAMDEDINEEEQEDDFYDAPSYNDRQTSNNASMEEELDELEDEQESPDEPSIGMKRLHDQEEQENVDSADKRHGREPFVKSEISEEDVESQGSLIDSNDEEDDASLAWGEDNEFTTEQDDSDVTPFTHHGIYQPPPPAYLRRSRSTSYSSFTSVSRSNAKSSSNHAHAENTQQDQTPEDQDKNHASTHNTHTFTHLDSNQHVNSADDTSDARQQSNDTSRQPRLPEGLPNTVNLGPAASIVIPGDDDDQPMSRSVAQHKRQVQGRPDVARGGTTRGRNLQQSPSDISNTRQQESQPNHQSSTSVTTATVTQRIRRRRELPSRSERDIAPVIQPEQQQGGLRKLNEYWTDEEVAALDEGLRLYSRRWMVIKTRYADVLANRSNVQLKDKARNIARQRRRQGIPLEHYAGCG